MVRSRRIHDQVDPSFSVAVTWARALGKILGTRIHEAVIWHRCKLPAEAGQVPLQQLETFLPIEPKRARTNGHAEGAEPEKLDDANGHG